MITYNSKKMLSKSMSIVNTVDNFSNIFTKIDFNIGIIINNLLNGVFNNTKIEDINYLYNWIDNNFIINDKMDIPYIGGYSKDKDIIYIDRRTKDHFNREEIKLFAIHEFIEVILLRSNYGEKLGYVYSHQFAQQIESLFHDNIDLMQERINKFETILLKSLSDYGILNIPSDLDDTPYIEMGDKKLLDNKKKLSRFF